MSPLAPAHGDFAGSDELTLTQEFLAQMLGVTRPSVSTVASPLQKAGLIKYSRGHIRVLDVEGLKKEACECYDTVKATLPAAAFELELTQRFGGYPGNSAPVPL